jgi:uncharacterized protein (DUF433 family)
MKGTKSISIVDHGRGPQLSTTRITVQDLVPYIRQNYSHEQILGIVPVLTREEIHVVEQYIQDNYDAVMEQDRRIRERAASRREPPEVEEAERKQRLERLENARQMIRQQERKCDRAAS